MARSSATLDGPASATLGVMAAARGPKSQSQPVQSDEPVGFSEHGRRIAREITSGPELAHLLRELDREEYELAFGELRG